MRKVPWGVLQQAVVRGGRRLALVEPLFPESTLEAVYAPYNPQRSGGYGYGSRGPMPMNPPHSTAATALALVKKEPEKPNLGNLPNDDYRFWIGCQNVASGYAKCRSCEFITYQTDTRKIHQESGVCKSLTLAAYQLLRRDKKCVVCNKEAPKTYWGIPLCSAACANNYRWYVPNVFREARKLAITRNPGLLDEKEGWNPLCVATTPASIKG